MPSNFNEKNVIVFWGQYPGNFETKFFPLRFEGILYNSVLTSKYLLNVPKLGMRNIQAVGDRSYIMTAKELVVWVQKLEIFVDV